MLRFQTTYEELKRCCWMETVNSWASRLPMRNWNRVSERKKSLNLSMASRLPMRNWNRSLSELASQSTWLPDYLWGIETCLHNQAVYCLWWLPDYLWGIETSFNARKRFNKIKGFQTTYEELKHWHCFSPSLEFGFQTTYEELKRILVWTSCSVNSLPDYLWGIETPFDGFRVLFHKGFQTTYEELKLVSITKQYIAFDASRLPMRNWNL